jgi:dienelactone hydrolase
VVQDVRASAAPAEAFTAKDAPLEIGRAEGQQAEWLKSFSHEPAEFKYTLRLIEDVESGEEDGQGVRVYRLTFPSPLETPWPENNSVPAEYYVPVGASPDEKVPAAVVLDILDGSAIVPRMLARAAAHQGVAALYLPMPCYNVRRPKDNGHEKLLRDDPSRLGDGMRQTVMDVRRAKAILASRPEVDPHRLGITGVSLGGIMTALSAGVDGQFDRVVPILAGGDVAALMFHTRETRKIRALLEAKGITKNDAAKILAAVEPLNYASRIDPARCFMINAGNDEVIPKATTEALNKAIGGAEILWLPTGHYTALTYLPLIQQRTIEFLKSDGGAAGGSGDGG